MDTLNLIQSNLKGDLEIYPVEIVKELLKNQKAQTGKIDISVFENNISASVDQGGFLWSSTEEGHDYWDKIISKKNISEFHAYKNGAFSNPTKNDLILQLTNIPLPLVKMMVNEQKLQGINPCFKVFQLNLSADQYEGGFKWEKSSQGFDFWCNCLSLAKKGKLMPALIKMLNDHPEILNEDLFMHLK